MFKIGEFVEVSEHFWSRSKTYGGVVTAIADANRLWVRPFGEHGDRALDITPNKYGRLDSVKPLTVGRTPTKFTDAQRIVLRSLYRARLDGAPRAFKHSEEVKVATLAVLDRAGLIEPVQVDGNPYAQPWQLTEAGCAAAQPIYGYPGWGELWRAVDADYRRTVLWMKELPVMLAISRYGMDCPDAEISVGRSYNEDNAVIVSYSAKIGGVTVERRNEHYGIHPRFKESWNGYTPEAVDLMVQHLAQASNLAWRWNKAAVEEV